MPVRIVFAKGFSLSLFSYVVLYLHVSQNPNDLNNRVNGDNIFLKFKSFIDINTNKLKVYIPNNLKFELNDLVINTSVNHGYGRLLNNSSPDDYLISTLTTDVSGKLLVMLRNVYIADLEAKRSIIGQCNFFLVIKR